MKLFANLTIATGLVLALVACNKNNTEITEPTTEETNQQAASQVEQAASQVEQAASQVEQAASQPKSGGDGAEVSLSWSGLYEGDLLNPKTNQKAAVKLTLNDDYTFNLTEIYGKRSQISKGKFKFNGSLINLGDDGNHIFFIGEGYAQARKFYGKEIQAGDDTRLKQTQYFNEDI